MAQAVMQLFASRDSTKYWARAVAMMRQGFGGHAYGPDEAVVQERRKGRIGGFFREED
jgi:6-phosphogluconate dehydrogenase